MPFVMSTIPFVMSTIPFVCHVNYSACRVNHSVYRLKHSVCRMNHSFCRVVFPYPTNKSIFLAFKVERSSIPVRVTRLSELPVFRLSCSLSRTAQFKVDINSIPVGRVTRLSEPWGLSCEPFPLLSPRTP